MRTTPGCAASLATWLAGTSATVALPSWSRWTTLPPRLRTSASSLPLWSRVMITRMVEYGSADAFWLTTSSTWPGWVLVGFAAADPGRLPTTSTTLAPAASPRRARTDFKGMASIWSDDRVRHDHRPPPSRGTSGEFGRPLLIRAL